MDTKIAFQFNENSGVSAIFFFFRLNSFLAIFTAFFKMPLNLLDSEGVHLTLLLSSSITYSPVSFFFLTLLLFSSFISSLVCPFFKGTVQRELRGGGQNWYQSIHYDILSFRQVFFTLPQGTPSREEHKRFQRL